MTRSSACREGLQLVPVTLREANAYIAAHHRHHPPARGCIAVVGVERDGVVVGVGVMGRPSARMLQDGYCAEVTRCCTDGSANVCSMIYGALWRAARALGYRRLVTYTLPEEGGASLRASGFRVVGEVRKQSWHRANRPRVNVIEPQTKLRWEIAA